MKNNDHPLIAVFSSPKPFIDAHIDLIQRNAIRSWQALGESLEILLIGDEPGMAEVCAEYGLIHVSDVERNRQGTPLISSIFSLARENCQAPVMAYLNADIIILPDFLVGVNRVRQELDRFLILGQRWDLEVKEPLDFSDPSSVRLRERIEKSGHLHPPGGSDYFIFPRECFQDIPPFALGRAGWDNWMIFAGRRANIPVVDGTNAITIVHQDHDYTHLPLGKPHYNLPETEENIRIAGGQEMVFTIRDANWKLTPDSLAPGIHPETTWIRRIESALYSSFGPGKRSRWVRLLLHPRQTLGYYFGRIRLRFFPKEAV